MSNVWFISDTHFCHSNMLKFVDNLTGKRIRPFGSVEEMNELMVERWNQNVKHGDKVYHQGDVTFQYDRPFRSIMARLNGKKRLLLGNHDTLKGTNLMDYFEKVEMWRVFGKEGFVCTHVPINRRQFRNAVLNVHGHVHQSSLDEIWYMNVSVEAIDYTPVHMDRIMDRVREVRRSL